MIEFRQILSGSHEGDDWVVYEHLKGMGVTSPADQINALFGAIALVLDQYDRDLADAAKQISNAKHNISAAIEEYTNTRDDNALRLLLKSHDLIADTLGFDAQQTRLIEWMLGAKERLLSTYSRISHGCSNIDRQLHDVDENDIAVESYLEPILNDDEEEETDDDIK